MRIWPTGKRSPKARKRSHWSLLKWARDYRNRFFEQMVPKAMAARAKHEESDEQGADTDHGLEEVRKMLDGVNQQMEESLATDVPAVVQNGDRIALVVANGACAIRFDVGPKQVRTGTKYNGHSGHAQLVETPRAALSETGSDWALRRVSLVVEELDASANYAAGIMPQCPWG